MIRTVGERLVIAGGSLRGPCTACTDCSKITWDADGLHRASAAFPTRARLAVGPIDDRQVPTLEYREPFLADCFDGDWCARNRVNSSFSRLEAKHGGKVKITSLAHTFQFLVPPEKYYKQHPEYFSLVDGKRMDGYAQLCCTNPDVIRLCSEGLRDLMRANPDGDVFSVSQNDCFNHCECPKCQEVAKREGSQMGPVLQLVNHAAEAVEREFPNKIVTTLAYQWTRHPPKLTRPRPNVVIVLCSIECCFAHPVATCDSEANKAFCADVEGWSKIAPRLWVWDYVTDFANYLLPFPNHQSLGPNIRYYAEHNVKGIFEEDACDTVQDEMAPLDGYVMAKCLWNPRYDASRATAEFLEAYYGEAAAPIRSYLDLLHNRVHRENIHVGCYAPVTHPHLTDELLVQADQLWQQAEDLGRLSRSCSNE